MTKTKQNVTSFKDAVSAASLNAAGAVNERLEALQNKAILRDEAKSALADAKSALDEINSIQLVGDDKAKDAKERLQNASGKAAFSLFRMEATGVASKEETSALLGETFGFKMTGNGKVSKTPDGEGEAIRKRVVRAVDAYRFVHTGQATSFFAPLAGHSDAVESVAEYVSGMMEGSYSLFTVYNNLQDMVKEYREKPEPLHLNADRLRKDMIQRLADLDVVHRLATDETLRNAYAEVIGAMTTVLNAAEGIASNAGPEAQAA